MAASEQFLTETTTGGGWFKTTHWSTVLEAGRGESALAQAALAKLCQAYWHPIYSFVRRTGRSPEDARDLTQEFFARLLEKDYLKAVEREKGKFRNFLLMALKRFLANEYDRANRQKRGGGCEIISLDENDAETRYLAGLVDDWTPEKAFEQRWAVALLEQVVDRLAEELAGEGKGKVFAELRVFLTGEGGQGSYPEIARRLGMTEGNVRVTTHRLRQRYRDLLRMEIAHTVDSPEVVDDEIRHLFAALG